MLKAGARADLSGLASARREAPQDRRPMSLAEAWALLKVPSSETGIQTYYRTLLNRSADAESLVQAIEALRLGELARINLIASLALSPEARLRGRNGPGVLLIRVANSAFERSGLGGRVRRRRARVAAAEATALERRETRSIVRPGVAAPGLDTSGLAARVALLEDLLVRTEARVSALQRDRPDEDPAAALAARVQALETAVIALLQPHRSRPARVKRAWKALPTGVRASAHRGVRSLLDAATPAMVALNWRRGAEGGGRVTVAGLHSSSIGIGRGARLFTAALQQAGVEVQICDVGPTIQVASDLSAPDPSSCPERAANGDVLVTHLNPPELILWLQRTGARGLRGRRHIGYWAWELPALPDAWSSAFHYVDEVWCPSEFTAQAVRSRAPPSLPVRVVPHPVFMTSRLAPARDRLGLPAEACVVLAALDLKSTSARKNPLGAIEAYRRAVPMPNGRSLLVCKLAGGSHAPERLAEVEAATAGRSDILLMREPLSEADMTRLIASADIVVSLHRAEGFGLLAAEAMWLGKPVVATAWSGVMDFLDEETAALVPWTPRPVEDVQAMYAGGWWAEPDLDIAAARLHALIADPCARSTLGARAAAKAAATFEAAAWGARVRTLLDGREPAIVVG